MKNFNKPSYIPEQFLTATNQGWIDNRTGEILVALPNLLNRLNLQPEAKKTEEVISQSTVQEEVKEQPITTIDKVEESIVEVVAKPTEEIKVEEAPKRKYNKKAK